MTTVSPSPARTAFFQKLKPFCVRISQVAIRLPQDGQQDSPALVAASKDLVEQTNHLLGLLNAQVKADASVLDEKLAEYIFFPLGHVFRSLEKYSHLVIETSLQCLQVLIQYGWQSKISPQLIQQLLTLLIFIADGKESRAKTQTTATGGRTKDVPEETAIIAFGTLSTLLTTARSSPTGSAALVEPASIPSLGHSITVMLDGVTDGQSPQVQLAALNCVQQVFATIKDNAALATFLPGTVSALSKVLAQPARQKNKVLSTSIRTLQSVLIRVLADIRTRGLSSTSMEKDTATVLIAETAAPEVGSSAGSETSNKVLTKPWLSATSAQIKLALSTVLRLRSQRDQDVCAALERLCISLLDECHLSLSNCAEMLVETAIILAPETSHDDNYNQDNDTNSAGGGAGGIGAMFTIETSRHDLSILSPELSDAVKTTVYNWMLSLPRVMQSSEDTVKSQAMRGLARGIRIVSDLNLDSATLRDLTAATFRDSVVSLLVNTSSQTASIAELLPDVTSLSNTGLVQSTQNEDGEFTPIIVPQESQARIRKEMLQLLASAGSPSQQVSLAAELLDFARDSMGNAQISSFWVSFQLMKSAIQQTQTTSEFLDFSTLSTSTAPLEEVDAVFDELLSFAISIVDSHTDMADVDWQVEAIALEVTTFAASRAGLDFRPELIDVLYPVATFLGSPNPQLRSHAIISLNHIASSCGYSNVSDLIVENADYMVNSVALRLNTLDITPTSTRVLAMLIKLSGPRIIPFLDDVVASIFSALDNYHGYPAFVETLFAVLKEIVDQGAVSSNSSRLLIRHRETGSGANAVDHKKKPIEPVTVEKLLDFFDKREAAKEKRRQEDAEIDALPAGHPERPWKQEQHDKDGMEQHQDDVGEGPVEEKPQPNTPTYDLLLKIANLTQHYLTSPSPTLKKSLLDLVGTVASALAQTENEFLPLVNAIWPVVMARLYDAEPYIAVAACDTLSILCATAGDFLSSRIKTEWADGLEKWCRRVKQQGRQTAQLRSTTAQSKTLTESTSEILIPGRSGMLASKPTKSDLTSSGAGVVGLGRFAQSVRVWNGVEKLLTAIVAHVRIDDGMYDQVLELLADSLERNSEAREALTIVNPDAVWLAMYNRGRVEVMATPQVEGFSFVDMERMVA